MDPVVTLQRMLKTPGQDYVLPSQICIFFRAVGLRWPDPHNIPKIFGLNQMVFDTSKRGFIQGLPFVKSLSKRAGDFIIAAAFSGRVNGSETHVLRTDRHENIVQKHGRE